MADIFVSYARQDKARVAPLVAALERQGWSVWWDPAIMPGEEFDALIRREIKAAEALIVVWTPASTASRWVRGEARLGAERGILVPVRFDQAELPIDAMTIHTTDLDSWKEDTRSAAFQEMLAALSRLLKAVPHKSSAPEAEKRETSICVLPFVNMSGDPEQEYFSDGLSEELMNQLAQMAGLKVAARTSSFAFKGQNPNLKTVSEALGVAHVLEGSVRKAGNRLRITAQLIKAADGFHLWSNTFNREIDDVFQIQEDIARAVAEALKIKLGLGGSTLIPGGTRNTQAYDLYLRAMTLARQGGGQSTQRAIALLRESVELDPHFAMGWANLGVGYINAIVWSPATAEASRRLSDEAFERAISCAPDSWMIHEMKALQLFILRRDFIGAADSMAKAIALAPSGARPTGGSPWFLASTGQITEAIKGYAEGVQAEPMMQSVMFQFVLDCAGRYDEADRDYKRCLSLPYDPALPELFAFRRTLAREGSQTAKLQLKRYLSLNDGYMPVYHDLLAKFDDKAAVLALLHKAYEEPYYQDAGHATGLAHIAAHYGDAEFALACLRRAFIDDKGIQFVEIWHPAYANLRKTGGFKQLVRDLGLYDYWRKTGEWGDFARPLGDDDFEIIR